MSVEGPVVLEPAMHDELAMATRYLGDELGAWYVEHNPRTDESLDRPAPARALAHVRFRQAVLNRPARGA